MRVLLDLEFELVPPFIIVAEHRKEGVSIRLRQPDAGGDQATSGTS
jgi:hypothetical protein